VLTSTVADTARFLDSVVGPDGRDPLALPHPGVSYETGVGAVELAGLRVAWTPGVGFAPSEPEVVATVRDGARALVDTTGMTEVAIDVDLPDPAVAWDVQGLPDLYGALKPFMPERSEEISPELQAAYEDAGKLTVDDFFRASMVRHALCQAVAELFEQIDLLLLPTTSTSAFAAEGPMPGEIAGIPVTPLESVAPTYTFNISGNPAVSVPAGEVDGAPVGLQIVGRHHDDLLVLAAAAALESARPWPRIAPEPALATDSR
jgi:aspartyl-tRNA(Asn)/glutamyl-tRNA(Gln) amidotransferase subunit A